VSVGGLREGRGTRMLSDRPRRSRRDQDFAGPSQLVRWDTM